MRWLTSIGWAVVDYDIPSHRELYNQPTREQSPGWAIMRMTAPSGELLEVRVPGARNPAAMLSVAEWKQLMVSTLMPMWWRVFNKPLPVMPRCFPKRPGPVGGRH